MAVSKIFLIARREFLLTVGRPIYIIALIAPPILMMVAGITMVLLLRPGKDHRDGGRVGLIDSVNVIDPKLIKNGKPENRTAPSNLDTAQNTLFLPYKDLAEALRDLRGSKLEVLYVIGPDYIQ